MCVCVCVCIYIYLYIYLYGGEGNYIIFTDTCKLKCWKIKDIYLITCSSGLDLNNGGYTTGHVLPSTFQSISNLVWFSLVSLFNGISTFVGYLMSKL